VQNQLADIEEKKSKSVAAGLGLGAAALLAAGQADAATEAFQLAAGDNRLGVIATLFIPALGWVAFNMFQPFLNQLAGETWTYAIHDVLLFLAQHVTGHVHGDEGWEKPDMSKEGKPPCCATQQWQPLALFDFADIESKKNKSVAAGLGLGAAALLAAGQADAATEALQLAAGDNRLGVIATLFIPALGWVRLCQYRLVA
jgi:photosystem II PsbY protein